MIGSIGGVVLIVLGVGMIFLGRPRNGVERAFIRSWPLFVGYLITSLALIVLGVAWLIRSIGMAS